MDLYSMPDDRASNGTSLEKQLFLLNPLPPTGFDQAKKLIDCKLEAALDSLSQSASAIRLLLEAQSVAELATAAGASLRYDLEGLLASSTHLSRLAGMMQQSLAGGTQACEQRTERDIANVVDAVAKHRTAVQNNAIALTEAALDKARAPSPISHVSRAVERRAR